MSNLTHIERLEEIIRCQKIHIHSLQKLLKDHSISLRSHSKNMVEIVDNIHQLESAIRTEEKKCQENIARLRELYRIC